MPQRATSKVEHASSEPIFILCLARSGSTLLTRLLDMHERIVGPAETNLSSACQQVVHTVQAFGQEFVTDDRSAKHERERAVAQARKMANSAIRTYLGRRSENILVDKSLSNVEQAELLLECFPEARFVCLYRHCLDVVCSLIEASPWGFDAYGAATYVARSPVNFVAGLVDMWNLATTRQVEFAKAHPASTTTVRYEDLVRQPQVVMGALFKRFGLKAPEALRDSGDQRQLALDRHLNAGAADYKIAFTRFVDTASVGRGKTVPFAAVPRPLLEAANELLHGLGYPKIDEDWNRGVMSGEPATCTESGRVALDVIVRQLEDRLANAASGDHSDARVALEDVGSTLVVDFQAKRVRVESGLAEPHCISASHSLLGALLGHANVGTLLRRGEFRVCKPEESVPGRSLASQLDALLELLVAPSADATDGTTKRGESEDLH
ncbi:MAG: sulfotransferase family protein [Acidimicrobiales bacterium]